MCGEQSGPAGLDGSIRGSPPRVRGTVHLCPEILPVVGITPACAGNSSLPTRPNNAIKDHPRVCGEQGEAPELPGNEKGSPPRVRGTGVGRAEPAGGQGITPACAGNSTGG